MGLSDGARLLASTWLDDGQPRVHVGKANGGKRITILHCWIIGHTIGCLFSTLIPSICGYCLDPVQTLLPII
jgi:hypothetical protein